MEAVELGELGKMRVPFTNMNFIRTVRGNRAFESGSCSVRVESEGVFTSDLVMLTWLHVTCHGYRISVDFLSIFFFPSWTLFSYKTVHSTRPILSPVVFTFVLSSSTAHHASVLLLTSSMTCRGG